MNLSAINMRFIYLFIFQRGGKRQRQREGGRQRERENES